MDAGESGVLKNPNGIAGQVGMAITARFLTPLYAWLPLKLREGVRNDSYGNGDNNHGPPEGGTTNEGSAKTG
jgi:hypothetical protein